MSMHFPLRPIAGSFALACFAVAVVAGLAAGRATDEILTNAILALLAGQAVGLGAGWVLYRLWSEACERHQRAVPLPNDAGDAAPHSAKTR